MLPDAKTRVLVIEDDPVYFEILMFAVTHDDPLFDLTHALTHKDGMALLDSPGGQPFSLVLLDLNLPDCSGLDNVRQTLQHTGEMPVVILTGNDDNATAIEAVRLGAEDYLVKQDMTGRVMTRVMRHAIERRRMKVELAQLALTDDLTGLNNRRAFLALSAQQLAVGRRNNQAMLMVFADMDGLKKINDTQGHEAGDRAIAATAAVLKSCFRETDVIARLGGDEFAVSLLESAPDTLEMILHRLHANLAASNLAMSVGTARLSPDDDGTLESLMAEADARLYEQKRTRSTRG